MNLIISLKMQFCRVHFIAQPANRYVMAFHIAISYDIYSHTRWWQSRDADSGGTSICRSDGNDIWSADVFTYRLQSADFLESMD